MLILVQSLLNNESLDVNKIMTKIVSNDNTIRVWNVDTSECILTLKGADVYSVDLIMMVQKVYLL